MVLFVCQLFRRQPIRLLFIIGVVVAFLLIINNFDYYTWKASYLANRKIKNAHSFHETVNEFYTKRSIKFFLNCLNPIFIDRVKQRTIDNKKNVSVFSNIC